MSLVAKAVSIQSRMGFLCNMIPFSRDLDFYVVDADNSVRSVSLLVNGTDVYDSDDNLVLGSINVDLPQVFDPHLVVLQSCPQDLSPSSGSCTRFTFDIYRRETLCQ